MSEPSFLIQIIDRGDRVAILPGGGPLEANLIDLCTKQIMSKGVGLFKTEAAVEKAIRDGMAEALLSLKLKTMSIA
jgi:hypothetical protein